MAVELNSFFQALAERNSKLTTPRENRLSDMTYALCQSDTAFKQFFLDFFFGCGNIDVLRDKVEITRESFSDEGRPDFEIRVGDDSTYLIEVKIQDGNHHFSQYKAVLDNRGKNIEGHLGYIANYVIDPSGLSKDDKAAYKKACDKGKTVKTWKEFVRKLESYQAFNDPVIEGYIHYVRSVCPFDDFELSEASIVAALDFKEVALFINGLAQKIESMAPDGVFPYPSSKKFGSQGHMGHVFELRKYAGENSVWGWVGANYTQDGAVVLVEFENKDGWGKPVCEQFKDLHVKDDLRFYLKDGSVKWDVFFEEVITYVKAKGEAPLPSSVCLNIDGAARIKSLLVMKSLPWLLDRFFLSSANKQLSQLGGANNMWEVSSPDAGPRDSEKQDSHCGRFYTLMHNRQKYIEFWIGALYDNSLSIQTGFPFSEQPKILFDVSKDDFERTRLTSVPDDKFQWYEIEKGKRVVCEIKPSEIGKIGKIGENKFCDIVNCAVAIIKTIIDGKVIS